MERRTHQFHDTRVPKPTASARSKSPQMPIGARRPSVRSRISRSGRASRCRSRSSTPRLHQAGGGAGECPDRWARPQIAEAIQQAAAEVARGDLDSQFPLVIWQTGSGTQSNMNANEVIAGRANEKLSGARGGKSPVHPNDHVNRGSRRTTASRPRCTCRRPRGRTRFCRRCGPCHDRLADLAERWDGIVKIGRTHLQDATPLTLGQEFSGYAQQIADNIERVEGVMPRVYRLRRAAPRSAPGSTLRRASPTRSPRKSRA